MEALAATTNFMGWVTFSRGGNIWDTLGGYRDRQTNKRGDIQKDGQHRRVKPPLIATLKPQSNGPSYSNIVIGTLAVDGWAVTFGIARRGLGGATARPGPSLLYQM